MSFEIKAKNLESLHIETSSKDGAVMISWRNNTSTQAQNDLDELFNTSLGFAQEQLAKNGEFFPYPVALNDNGEFVMIAAHPGVNNEGAAQGLVDCVVHQLAVAS